jgi:hypothetical protein
MKLFMAEAPGHYGCGYALISANSAEERLLEL